MMLVSEERIIADRITDNVVVSELLLRNAMEVLHRIILCQEVSHRKVLRRTPYVDIIHAAIIAPTVSFMMIFRSHSQVDSLSSNRPCSSLERDEDHWE